MGTFDLANGDDGQAGPLNLVHTDFVRLPSNDFRAVCTITADDARTIFVSRKHQRKRDGLAKRMAQQFGITPKAVRDIWNLRTWCKETAPQWSTTDAQHFLSRSLCPGCKARGLTLIEQACKTCRSKRTWAWQYLGHPSSKRQAGAACHHPPAASAPPQDGSAAHRVKAVNEDGRTISSTSRAPQNLTALAAPRPELRDLSVAGKLTISLDGCATSTTNYLADKNQGGQRHQVHQVSQDKLHHDISHRFMPAPAAICNWGRFEGGECLVSSSPSSASSWILKIPDLWVKP